MSIETVMMWGLVGIFGVFVSAGLVAKLQRRRVIEADEAAGQRLERKFRPEGRSAVAIAFQETDGIWR
jgi:hypothetical protein